MCRNIKTLFNFDPPVTSEEIAASSLQYVRKISGSKIPAKINQLAFELAVAKIAQATEELLDTLVAKGPVKNR